MIKDTIKKHDDFHSEFKIQYPGIDKKTDYVTDLYFFIPNTLNVNEKTLSSEDFYKEIKSFIRLSTPKIPFERYDSGSTDDPFLLLKQDSKGKIDKHDLKLFGAIWKSTLRDFAFRIKKEKNISRKTVLIKHFENEIRRIATKIRSLFLTSILDEYISYMIENYVLIVVEQNKRQSKDLIKFLKEEINYREKKGFPIAKKGCNNELYIYRKGLLKKHFSSVLFLHTHSQHEKKIIEQVFYGISAGVAVFFATIATFFFGNRGTFGIELVLIAVVTYIVKDRIKDLLKLIFSRSVNRRLPDKSFKLYSGKKLIGKISENFSFINRAPKDVYAKRKRTRGIYYKEHIFHYKKKITLYYGKMVPIFGNFPITAVDDILRFSVKSFLDKMANPEIDLPIIHESNLEHVKSKKVYHVNLVLRYKSDGFSKLKHYTLILSRNGIQRIEKIDS